MKRNRIFEYSLLPIKNIEVEFVQHNVFIYPVHWDNLRSHRLIGDVFPNTDFFDLIMVNIYHGTVADIDHFTLYALGVVLASSQQAYQYKYQINESFSWYYFVVHSCKHIKKKWITRIFYQKSVLNNQNRPKSGWFYVFKQYFTCKDCGKTISFSLTGVNVCGRGGSMECLCQRTWDSWRLSG